MGGLLKVVALGMHALSCRANKPSLYVLNSLSDD